MGRSWNGNNSSTSICVSQCLRPGIRARDKEWDTQSKGDVEPVPAAAAAIEVADISIYAIISCRWGRIAASGDILTECVRFAVPVACAVTMDPISKAALFANQARACCFEQAAINDVGVDRAGSPIQIDLDEGMIDERKRCERPTCSVH